MKGTIYGKQIKSVFIGTKRGQAIEYAPIVRCKHCDCWCEDLKVGRHEFGNVTAPCSEWSNEDGYIVYTSPDEFCSRGERRTDEP